MGTCAEVVASTIIGEGLMKQLDRRFHLLWKVKPIAQLLTVCAAVFAVLGESSRQLGAARTRKMWASLSSPHCLIVITHWPPALAIVPPIRLSV